MSDLVPDLEHDVDDLDTDADEELVEPATMIKIAAPFLALGAAFLVRKVMDSAYERTTGRKPPTAGDRTNSLGRVLMYAAATAAAIAVVNVVIDRATAPHPAGQA
jgi:hypothetical protein